MTKIPIPAQKPSLVILAEVMHNVFTNILEVAALIFIHLICMLKSGPHHNPPHPWYSQFPLQYTSLYQK